LFLLSPNFIIRTYVDEGFDENTRHIVKGKIHKRVHSKEVKERHLTTIIRVYRLDAKEEILRRSRGGYRIAA
jgi:hypothetical protein